MSGLARRGCCGAVGLLVYARRHVASAAATLKDPGVSLLADGAVSEPTCEVKKTAWSFTVKSSEILMPDGARVAVRIFSPDTPWAAAVFAHGGCFTLGDCDTQSSVSEMLAGMGVAVVASSFRQGASNPHPAALNDLSAIVSYARADLWPGLAVGVVGGSSGGYFALALAREPYNLALPFCVALCPVAHPGLRARYLRSCVDGTAARDGYSVKHTPAHAASMLRMQTGYWRTDDAMEAAGNLLLSPSAVPTFILLGAADKNVPAQVTNGVQGWATKTVVLGGRGHELQDGPAADRGASHLYALDLERFLRSAVAK